MGKCLTAACSMGKGKERERETWCANISNFLQTGDGYCGFAVRLCMKERERERELEFWVGGGFGSFRSRQ